MISKAKALFYHVFNPQTKIPPTHIPVRWFHKLVLVKVGRYPKLKDVPETVSQFDWLRAQQDFGIFVRGVRRWFFISILLSASFGYRYYHSKQLDIELATQRAKGIPDVPKFVVGGENEFYKDYIPE